MTSPSVGVAEKTRLRLKNFSLPVWLILICFVTEMEAKPTFCKRGM
jgi:hypothetical protein